MGRGIWNENILATAVIEAQMATSQQVMCELLDMNFFKTYMYLCKPKEFFLLVRLDVIFILYTRSSQVFQFFPITDSSASIFIIYPRSGISYYIVRGYSIAVYDAPMQLSAKNNV